MIDEMTCKRWDFDHFWHHLRLIRLLLLQSQSISQALELNNDWRVVHGHICYAAPTDDPTTSPAPLPRGFVQAAGGPVVNVA